jgi:UPF0271 protein
LLEVVSRCAPAAAIFGPPAGELREATIRAGRLFVPEGFIDRGYLPDGNLVPRGEAGDVLHDHEAIVAQMLRLVRAGCVRTLCVHGDGPEALRWLGAARTALRTQGIRIARPGPL